MTDKPVLPQDIIEAFEVSGYGRDELPASVSEQLAEVLAQQPELAAIYAHSKQLDEVLRRTVRDVPVPEGLQQRILDRLSSVAGPEDADELAKQVDRHKTASVRTTSSARRRFSRRRWISVSVGLLTASVLVGFLCLQAPEVLSSARIMDEAGSRFITANMPPGEPLSNAVVKRYPLSSEVPLAAASRWRKIDDFLGHAAVAYEMTGWRNTRATLFVMPYSPKVKHLGATPPRRSFNATGGRAIGAWQVDGLVYVLVVEGNDRAYHAFLRPSSPLT